MRIIKLFFKFSGRHWKRWENLPYNTRFWKYYDPQGKKDNLEITKYTNDSAIISLYIPFVRSDYLIVKINGLTVL